MPSLAALLHDDVATNIVVSASRTADDGSKIWFNQFMASTAAADRFAAHLAKGGRNVYCKHGAHDGATHMRSNRVRPDCTIGHFLSSRAFFIDIDVGPKRPYATIKAAGEALRVALAGVTGLKLPAPNVVQLTGGGFQIVWATVDPYPQNEWRRLTGILFLLMRKFKLDIDQNLSSIDRGVRYCGDDFTNVNHGDPRATKVLRFDPKRIPNAIFQAVLDEQGKLRAVPQALPPYQGRDPFDIPSDFKLDLSLILDECKVLQEAVLTGGKDHDYKHWTNMLALCAKNGDESYGRELAHKISEEHLDYKEEITDGKFDSFLSHEKYPLCRTLHQSRPGLCETCSHYQKVNSPAGIQGKMRAIAQAQGIETAAATSQILSGFYFNSDKGVRRKMTGEEKAHPIIWPGVTILSVDLRRDDHMIGKEYLMLVLQYGQSKPYDLSLDVTRLGSVTKMVDALGGIVIGTGHQKGVHTAMVAWITELRNRVNSSVHHTRLGWTSDNDKLVLGRRLYHATGFTELPDTDRNLYEFEPHGNFDSFKEAANIILKYETRPEAHALIAGSLGGPLLELLGAPGIVSNFYSRESGRGKSTLMKLAASVWGRPRSMTFALDDTINSVIKRLGWFNHFPAFWDDIVIDAHTQHIAVDLAHRLTATQEKSRLGTSLQVEERSIWRLALEFASNTALLDVARATRGRRNEDAAIARILDFNIPPLPEGAFGYMPQVMAATAALENHWGWLGHRFAPYYVKNRTFITTELQKITAILLARAERTLGGVASRNHATTGACMIMAAKIAQGQDLFAIDAALVTKAVSTAIESIKVARLAAIEAGSPLNVIRDFMATNARHGITLVKGAGGKVDMDLTRLTPLRPFKFQIDLANREILIPVNEFCDWLGDNGKPYGKTLAELAEYRSKNQRRLCETIKTMRGAYMDMLRFPPVGPLAGFFDD